KNVWAFIETAAEEALPVGLELLTPGRSLADQRGEKLVAVVFGAENARAIQSAAELGADEIISLEGSDYQTYNTDVFTNALTELAKTYQPETILIGATGPGCDFAPRVSGRLNTGLVAHCTQLNIDPDSGHVAWTRPAFGSKLMATILCPNSRPQIGTIRPGVFSQPAAQSGRTCPVTAAHITPPENADRVRLIKAVSDAADAVLKLEDAELVVAAGLGVGGSEGLKLVEALAAALGAAVGATRPVADAGWVSEAQQIGQSGKTIHPKLYIACGISGAIHHVAGISRSNCIVAINKDPNAPIFEMADYGIVGDLFEVLPAITEEIKKLKH
ncbi:MAG TPA: electron transfer flavoprotein subunit alpha/FixB family protein, partial [Clostridia bacterium]|nr:electron transfer flavoprotein subunit alpha/FixB family protein [Clostridia bacterium]